MDMTTHRRRLLDDLFALNKLECTNFLTSIIDESNKLFKGDQLFAWFSFLRYFKPNKDLTTEMWFHFLSQPIHSITSIIIVGRVRHSFLAKTSTEHFSYTYLWRINLYFIIPYHDKFVSK